MAETVLIVVQCSVLIIKGKKDVGLKIYSIIMSYDTSSKFYLIFTGLERNSM